MLSYQKAITENKTIAKSLLPTDRHPADDLCVVAAMCLIKASMVNSTLSPNVFHILQAAIILEYAWTHSKPNFQITLLLIKLYSYLGCGSLAMRAYQRLGLKQVQLDTLSHTIFDRISSFHPHSFAHQPDESSPLLDPLHHLENQQDMYRNARENIRKQTWKAFEYGSYNAIFEIKEVRDKLFQSMANIMSSTESRRVSRLTESIPQSISAYGFEKIG
jgi:N-terminal acetyltransferase B complex non-catalytic subunit